MAAPERPFGAAYARSVIYYSMFISFTHIVSIVSSQVESAEAGRLRASIFIRVVRCSTITGKMLSTHHAPKTTFVVIAPLLGLTKVSRSCMLIF